MTWQLGVWCWPVVIAVASWFYLARPTLPHGWVGCLVLAVAVVFVRELPDGSLRMVCLQIARYSYGIYLAHFLLMWLAFDRLAGAPRAAQIAVFAVAMVAVPVALYHLVERPMIRVGERVARALRQGQRTSSGRRVRSAISRPIWILSSVPPHTGSSCSTEITPSKPPS